MAVAIAVYFVPVSTGMAQQTLTPAQFQANPAQVLTANPNGGPQFIALIRQLLLADQADLPLVIGLLATANNAQATAIGTALGQAALASVTSNQPYAAAILAALANANNAAANIAYAAVTGENPTAAAGGAGGGGGGGSPGGGGSVGSFAGSATGSSGSGGSAGTSGGTNNVASNFTLSGGGGASSSLTNITTSTVSGSVSP